MKIRLENFQGHSDSTIETVPGITAITGSTNAGKSSFLRAFSHVHQNSIRGNAYIKHGTDKCTITIDNVQRIKGKSTNQYIVDGNMTEALRSGVPHEVTEALKLADDCVQSQHSSIFLIDKSPGQVAQKLSELIDLEIAHRSIKLVDTERRAAFTEINSANSAISKANDRLQQLSIVQEVDFKLVSIERKAAVINELTKALTSLQASVKNAVECQQAINSLPNVAELIDGPKLKAEAKALDQERATISIIHNRIDTANKWKGKTLDIPTVFAEHWSIIRNALQNKAMLTGHITICKEMTSQINVLNGQLRAKEAAYIKLRGDRCPLCGGEYSK